MDNLYFLILIFILSLAFTYFMHRFFLLKSETYKLKKANNNAIRWRSQSKPVSGGFAFYSIFILSSIIYLMFFNLDISQSSNIIVIIIVATISFLMGLSDDIINTSPYFKFIVQLISAILLINFDIYIDISPNEYLNYALTIFWVVGIMNSVNMLDNMDSITSLITLTILINILATTFMIGEISNISLTIVIIAVIASLISFIPFNWFSAKVYMGDNGSQFLGILLASLGIIFIWNSNSTESYGYNSQQFTAVVLAFLIPLVDTTTVTINRLLKGKSPFIGGKDHTTHFLTYIGLGEKKAVLLLFFISIISNSFSFYVVNFIEDFNNYYFYGFGVFSLVVFLFLYINTRITKEK